MRRYYTCGDTNTKLVDTSVVEEARNYRCKHPCEDQPHGMSFSNKSGKMLYPTIVRNDPEVDLGLSGFCVLRGDPNITALYEFIASAQCVSIDVSNDRFAIRL